ncbi:MAG TPA: TonB-dependent receptor [Steroidobacteraceae bacterium]|nr:TonB-dependent receptor [Steroidobacteraceae bacterium]
MNTGRLLISLVLAGASGQALASGATAANLDEVVVTAGRIMLSGAPRAASEGTVLHEQLENRPLLRTGEILELVPGLVVTQHTGDGKANQYFLRGFNLDHGTDFLTRVEGMPVNMPTHAHGQGYMDLNFAIPELIERVTYHKGTYYPELGNFSAAGAAEFRYFDRLPPVLSLTGGEDEYLRAVAAGSLPFAGGDLLVALEYNTTDGPWELPQDLRKANGVARYSRATDEGAWSVDLMAYDGEWTATDQVPLRAVEDGTIGRFGFVDPSSGGETHRYSVSGQGHRAFGARRLDWSAWAMDYRLELFSNFTYALDPVNGDQFEQFDDRQVLGGSLEWSQPLDADARWQLRTGVELRHDDIAPVGLYLTTARERHDTIREDQVRQAQVGAWAGLETRWTEKFRSEAGLRYDTIDYEVASDLAANSGSGSDALASPKLSLVFGPWRETELFVAAGQGFHGNDIRGATIAVDPSDGVTPVDPVTPLVEADGMEAGLRTAIIPRMQLALALWQLKVDSELLFVGDGGATEASRPSRRRGVELGLYARPTDWMIVDADLAWSEPRFRDDDPAGDRIPGAVERVASLGVTFDLDGGWYGGARLRYLGPSALIEDDSVRAPGSTLVNLEAGRRFTERLKVTLGIYNVFDEDASDIRYFYESQLPGEPAPVADVHVHPVEPRTARLTVDFAL